MRRVTLLHKPTVLWIRSGVISFNYWMYIRLIMLGRLKHYSRAAGAWAQCLWSWCGCWKAKKIQVISKYLQNWLKQDVGQFVLRSINLLILFKITGNCFSCRSVIKLHSNDSGHVSLISYVQDHIQHLSVKVNSICR